jgi:hypothetical protein
MTKKVALLSATLLCAAFLAGGLSPARAQGAPPGGGPDQGGGGGEANSATQSATAQSPVGYITGIEVVHLDRAKIDMVHVTGLVVSINWGSASLVPLVRGSTTDGILDLAMVATAPNGTQAPSAYKEVDAWLPLQGSPYKGVRVRGAFNVVELKTLPGFAEGKAPELDLSEIVGKAYAAHGGAGAVSGDDLPPNTRVIKPTDPINDQTRDPNRMTIFLGDDGKIEDAYWN